MRRHLAVARSYPAGRAQSPGHVRRFRRSGKRSASRCRRRSSPGVLRAAGGGRRARRQGDRRRHTHPLSWRSRARCRRAARSSCSDARVALVLRMMTRAPHGLDERGATNTSFLPPADSGGSRTALERQPDPPPGAAATSSGDVTSQDGDSQPPRLTEHMRDRTPPSGPVRDDPSGTCPACHRLTFPSRTPSRELSAGRWSCSFQHPSTTPAWESTGSNLRVRPERRCALPTSAPSDAGPQLRAALAATESRRSGCDANGARAGDDVG